MRGYLLSIWTAVDPVYFKFSRLRYPTNDFKIDNILRVRLTRYKGKNVTLADGITINKHDTLVKIHLHNVRLLNELKDVKSNIIKGKIIFKYVSKSLPELEKYIQNHPKSNEIKGIIGITFLNKGCGRLGFEVMHIHHPVYRRFKWAGCLLIGALSSNPSIKKLIKKPAPSYLFMSKNKLTQMYQK
ncbi:YkoP family protein [Virgibacillus sp. DJP39]|uniref:YkoP family protein n=1 Tax=Virgibacillus sp. DJP39 TaxID=3409790 RepID=UPI003BB4C997